jgi:hypothetical protein
MTAAGGAVPVVQERRGSVIADATTQGADNARRLAHARPKRRRLPRMTDRLPLGRQPMLQVSPFCQGMVSTPDAVLTAFDAGINFFFLTADMHWPLYESTREGLRRLLARGPVMREQIVVGVVSYATQPEFCWVPYEEVLEAVPGLEHIDVTIAGGAYGHEYPARREVYRQHLAVGHVGVRAIGATFHDRHAAADAIAAGELDVAFIRYNPSHPGARTDVFPRVTRQTTTLVYNFKSLESFVDPARCAALGLDDAYWYPEPTDYYRFAVSRPEIDGVLCSPGTPAEVQSLRMALELGPLDEEEQTYLIDLASLDAAHP